MTDSQKTSHLAAVAQAERARVAEAQVAALLQDKAAAHARAEEREAEIDALTGQVAALVEAAQNVLADKGSFDHQEAVRTLRSLLSDLSAAAAKPSTPSAAAARLAWWVAPWVAARSSSM